MSKQEVLWGDQFAPVTSAIGFLRAPLDIVAGELASWRRTIHGSAQSERLQGDLRECVSALEPLTGGVRPRELIVATANPEWTALLDCGVQGGDPTTVVGYLARTLKVQGVVTVSVPAREATTTQRFGARQFELFGPISTDFLNYVRTISVVQDGGRWRFDAAGTVQPFEDLQAYERRRISERFTSEMLVRYAAEFGLRPLDGAFFPGPCVLVSNPAAPPPGALVVSIREAQQRAGIMTPSSSDL